MSTARRLTTRGFETVTASATCRFCGKDIYSAGGDANKGALGYLHLDTGNAKCEAPEMPRAEPVTDTDYHDAEEVAVTNEPQPAMPSDTSTPNGFDPALLAGINGVLSDRETGISLSDLSGDLWDNLIGPFFDSLEDAILDGDFDDDGIVTIDKTAAAYKGDE